MKCFNFSQKGKKFRIPDLPSKNAKFVKIFLIFFAIIFGTFRSSGQTYITLGSDIAICQGENVTLADLNPTVSGLSGDKWWTSSGDGNFSPTYLYPGASYYIPGSADIANGYFYLTLQGRLYNPDGTIFSDVVKILIQDDELFACNDNVIFPLNINCEFQITPPMLLEGENESEPYNLYEISIYDSSGELIAGNTLTGAYIGQTLDYTVTHECSWNACSGTITVKDNYHPVTACKTDTVTCMLPTEPEDIGFPIDTSKFDLDTIFKSGLKKYSVLGWDACGAVQLSYTDSILNYGCGDNLLFEKRIIRYWSAVDESNNISRCRDTIRVKRITIDSVIWPPSWNNIDTTALQCNGDWLLTALPDGNPSPDYTGFPEVYYCNQFTYNYIDSKFPGCGNNFDIVRDWTVVDWCTNQVKQYKQVIKIMDTHPPVIECITDTLHIGADAYECNSQKFELPIPQVYDECSSVNILVNVFNAQTNVEQSVQKVGNKYYIEHLPLKLYKVIITAVDQCNNLSKCTYYFDAKDDKNPYMACDQHTKVSLGTNGIARLNASSVDDGSFDNCGIAKMEIRRMSSECDTNHVKYGPYVDFCCVEANKTHMVEMKITDINGNFNSCMVEVEVEDKLPPQISCPPNILVSCDYFYDPNKLDDYFGKVVTDEALVEDIVIFDYYNNGNVGQDGYSFDNCNVSVTSTASFGLNNCNVGNIVRTFVTTDDGGRTNFCTQTITIQNPTPFNENCTDIIWPEDATFYGCSNLQADTSQTGAPIVNDNMCSMVAMTYEDQIFSVQNGACEKIVRTWTVRDWCQSNDHVWTYEQYIMLFNTNAPTFTSDCNYREICVYGQCEGLVELSASAVDDCTPPEDLDWAWKLDLNKDGIYDLFGQGNNFSKTMSQGLYTISWIVEDKCGNKSVCTYDFKVKECKKPTPLCISDLTTVVMNQAGMVSVVAKAFNHGSYDNCTPSNYGTCGCLTDLKFSFSENVGDTMRTFTCDDIDNGVAQTFYLNMWVTDLAGNQDYCSVVLQVQDNNGVCPDQGSIGVSGMITKWSDGLAAKNYSMILDSDNSEFYKTFSSQTDGRYNFTNVPEGYNYELKGKDNITTCAMGVTTADIVKIQKHILGISKFNTAYQYIAADANNSQSISASDIVEIRKIILGTNSHYTKNVCWTIADAAQIPETSEPFNYSDSKTLNNLNSSVSNANFKLIKIGDINDSHDVNTSGLIIRNDNKAVITIMNESVAENEEIEVPVFINSIDGFDGIQFTIKFNTSNLSYIGYRESRIDPIESNFGYNLIDNGYITFSWNSIKTISLTEKIPLFYLKFKVLNNVVIGDNIDINNDITSGLAVIGDNEYPVTFRLAEPENNIDKMIVYQNNPNPFTDETVISFNLPAEEDVEIKISDATGKVLYSKLNKYPAGFNQKRISSSELNAKGVLFYTLKVKDEVITKKMILIE